MVRSMAHRYGTPMRIAIVGTGYVGLVTAACFAELGHTVIGVDIDRKKIQKLSSGKSTIFEPGLEELIVHGLKGKRLSFTTDLQTTLHKVDIVFSAVATPQGKDHHADLSAVFTVTETVAASADHDILFVNKSTVPVGTERVCERRSADIQRKRKKKIRIPVVSNPEFLREGMAVSDTIMPERIVIGINESTAAGVHEPLLRKGVAKSSINARALMENLYRPISRTGKPIIFMSRESAEIVKYASNAFLATKISFINMLAELTEKTGANIRDVALGMGLDSRIGHRFLHAGIGYGGSCFPKDVKALLATARQCGCDFGIIEATDRMNTRARERFFEHILTFLPKKSTVGVWGLAFKPKTDDMREAPSLDLVSILIAAGHRIRAHDPATMENARKILPRGIRFCPSPLEAARGADALVLLTEWDEFRGGDLRELKKTMKGTDLFDGRNVYEPSAVKAAGLRYHGIGI